LFGPKRGARLAPKAKNMKVSKKAMTNIVVMKIPKVFQNLLYARNTWLASA
jgi:hypothetical protein